MDETIQREYQVGDKIKFKEYSDEKIGTIVGTRVDKPNYFLVVYTEVREVWVPAEKMKLDSMEMIKESEPKEK